MASVFGTPMLILGVQMGMGRRVPKLPGFIARRSIKRSDLLRLSGGDHLHSGTVEKPQTMIDKYAFLDAMEASGSAALDWTWTSATGSTTA